VQVFRELILNIYDVIKRKDFFDCVGGIVLDLQVFAKLIALKSYREQECFSLS
jgi:hypothetical protein